MSPTAPTIATLNDRLNEAHRRIRELQARDTELLARIGALNAVETVENHNRTTKQRLPSPIALQRWESDGGAQPTTV